MEEVHLQPLDLAPCDVGLDETWRRVVVSVLLSAIVI